MAASERWESELATSQRLPALGAVKAARFTGEALAVEINARVGRTGRDKLRVRVVGNSSYPWAEAVHLWGRKIEAVVVDNLQVITFLKQHCNLKPTYIQQAVALPPLGPWNDYLFATLVTPKDVDWFNRLFVKWKPKQAFVMLHGKFLRTQVLEMLPPSDSFYSRKLSKARHSQFGGVSVSEWHAVHYSRVSPCITVSRWMTAEHYLQVLQASLDDTEAPTSVRADFH